MVKKRVFLSAPVLIAVLILLALCASCSGVTVTAGPAAEVQYLFDIVCDSTQGNAYSACVDGYYASGTEITAHAVCAEGYGFYCWTTGGMLSDGGTDISHDPDYTFTLEQDTRLYANFRGTESVLLCYHLNGGSVVGDETGADTYWQEFSLAYYLYPNTLASLGYFEREGYQLIGYSYEPDGSGEMVNLGGKAFHDTDRVIDLWCVWAEEADTELFEFEYSDAYGAWFISEYEGGVETLCLPTEYKGEPVIGVMSGALSDADMTTLIIPDCYRFLQDYSCNRCESLVTLVLFDSLTYLSDETFDSDSALYTVYFSAATAPRFTTWFNNHSKKIECVVYAKDISPKIVCIGGSSTNYAIDCTEMEELLDGDYYVINMGTNGANLFDMTSLWVLPYMNEGDILLHIPEYSYWQLGGVQCTWETFRSFEGCYNVFSWVRANKYSLLFDCFYEFLSARSTMADTSYEDYKCTLAPNGYYTDQGELTVHVNGQTSDFDGGRRVYFGADWLYGFMIYDCNVRYAQFREKGVTPVITWTPYNRNALYTYQEEDDFDAFQDYMEEWFTAPIITDIHDAILDAENFFDDDYHLCYQSRLVYTQMVAEDLNAYLASAAAEEAAGTADTED